MKLDRIRATRKQGDNHCKTALRWTSEGKRARWRSETTRRMTMKTERRAGWRSWDEV